MNENQLEAIQSGLLQYVGALIKNTDREGAEAAHVALAKLSEVWLECCRGKDGKGYDLFIAKPILRAAAFLLEQYKLSLKKDLDGVTVLEEDPINQVFRDCDTAIALLDRLVESVKEHSA